jgi:hypothetical protein
MVRILCLKKRNFHSNSVIIKKEKQRIHTKGMKSRRKIFSKRLKKKKEKSSEENHTEESKRKILLRKIE